MILTEEDARTKWCPWVRVNVGGAYSVNRIWQKFKEWAEGRDKEFHVEQEANTKCCAAECMMWNFLTPSQAADLSMRNKGVLLDHAKHGYCGIALKL